MTNTEYRTGDHGSAAPDCHTQSRYENLIIIYFTKLLSSFIKLNIIYGDTKREIPILFSVDLLQNLENLDKEVDNVQVEVDCGDDIIFGRNSFHDHLRGGL